MPAKDEHIKNAQHNRLFWKSHDLDSTPFHDWVVTGIFYEAVHWVEAYLATKGDHPTTHGQRNSAISRHGELDSIVLDYDILKAESENARYACYKHTSDDIRNDLIPLVVNVEGYITTLL